jgi:hypothetical protein
MIRASPIIPPNTLPTITLTGAVVVDDEGDDVVVDVEEEGEEEAV